MSDDGRVFVPDQPVDLTIGQKVSVLVAEPAARPSLTLGQFLEGIAGDTESPTDGAAQHDHYLYKRPKLYHP